MARLLQDRDSTDLHLNLARRHQRLAKRYRQPGFAAAIQPDIVALKAKSVLSEDKDFERQGAYDDLLAADGDQDDAVRNLFDSAKTFDRSHPDAVVGPTLFPDGTFGDLVDEPLAREPDLVDALAVKVESLGATHALFPHAALLKTAAGAVRTAIRDLETAVRAQKTAEAEEEIAQGKLRRQYEGNYLDARKKVGRPLAEKLFPVVRSSAATPEVPPANP